MRRNVVYRNLIVAVGALIAVAPAASQAKSSPRTRITLIGELHGTVEIPRFFENLVRVAAHDDAPLAVGLEWPVSLQPLLDEAVREHLSCQPLRDLLFHSASWQHFLNIGDGRSSEAMVQLVCDLAALAQQSRVRLFVFDTEKAERNETMSRSMVSTLQQLKTSEALILVGNYHASTAARIGRFDWHPMGWWLQQQGFAVRSFDVLYEEGDAWACIPECGIHHMGSRIATARPPQHIGYDDVITLGKISASPPAATAAKP